MNGGAIPIGKAKMMTIDVVVSGQLARVRAGKRTKLRDVAERALRASGNEGAPLDEWELRRTDGALLDKSRTVAQVGLVEPATLFLSPRAGWAGSA